MATLITIIGPTAVGKTRLAIFLANLYQTEILSSDSRQIYRYMNIGTAKPTPEEMDKVPHHFIDIRNPDEVYSAAQFEAEAETLLTTFFTHKEVVVMVGGSTLYIDALWNGFDPMPEIDPEIRIQLNREWESSGLAPLQAELEASDPATWAQIDQQNPARIIRALEVFRGTGTPISVFRSGKKQKNPFYRIIKIGLTDDRDVLYARINQRVLDMIEAGLEKEVRALLDKGYAPSLPALQAIGYKEMVAYINGEIPLEEAIRLIQRNSRRYAKRQLTYYRRYSDIHWFGAGENEKILDWCTSQITY